MLRKIPVLYPVMWVWRLISKPFTAGKKMRYELKAALGLNREKKEE